MDFIFRDNLVCFYRIRSHDEFPNLFLFFLYQAGADDGNILSVEVYAGNGFLHRAVCMSGQNLEL